MNLNLTLIASKYVHFNKNAPLEQKLTEAMRYVRAHPHEVFWASGVPPADEQFKTAIAAVLFDATQHEKAEIERALLPLKALSAAMSGVPVDFTPVLGTTSHVLPLLKMWHDAMEDKHGQEETAR